MQRYDDSYGIVTSTVKGLKFESGGILELEGIINENL